MLKQDGLNFKEEEFDEALDYLIHHLQNDRGLWNEDEVLQELNKWRSSKSQAKTRELTLKIISRAEKVEEVSEYLDNEDEIVRIAAEEKIDDIKRREQEKEKQRNKVGNKTLAQKKKKALWRVDKISKVAEAKNILKQICESENVGEDIIDLINDYDA